MMVSIHTLSNACVDRPSAADQNWPSVEEVLSEVPYADLALSAGYATLSFHLKKHEVIYRPSEQLISEIVKRRHPKLLLCAGWSLFDKNALELVRRTTKDAASVVLAEVKNPWPPKYYRVASGESSPMGHQYFSTRCDTDGNAIRDLESAIDQRQFAVSGRIGFLLVCGELSILYGRKAVHFVKGSERLQDVILKAQVILNPTHDQG